MVRGSYAIGLIFIGEVVIMYKLIKAVGLIVILSVSIFTQGTDKYKKKGVSADYSLRQVISANRSFIKNRQFIKWL